jgi:hypothetical protein
LLAVALLLGATGCTSRGITITSVPEGAEVSINRRVVGKTPIRVSFTHYGTYRLELRKDKYQLLVREETVNPPVYGYDPVAAVADNLIPARLNDEVFVHFVMKPIEEKDDKTALSDRDALLARAESARGGKVTNPRTGQEVEVVITRPAPTKRTLDDPDAAERDVASATLPESALDKPQGLQSVIKEITTEAPAPPRLAKEYDVPVPEEKRADFLPPDSAKTDDAATTAERALRTPKDEDLIYAEPPPVLPAAKSDAKDKKSDAKNQAK